MFPLSSQRAGRLVKDKVYFQQTQEGGTSEKGKDTPSFWTENGHRPLRGQPGNPIHFSGSGQNPQPGAASENTQVCKLTPRNQSAISNTHSLPGHTQNRITKTARVLFPTPEIINPATASDLLRLLSYL